MSAAGPEMLFLLGRCRNAKVAQTTLVTFQPGAKGVPSPRSSEVLLMFRVFVGWFLGCSLKMHWQRMPVEQSKVVEEKPHHCPFIGLFSEAKDGVIKIPEPAEVVRAMLEFIYNRGMTLGARTVPTFSRCYALQAKAPCRAAAAVRDNQHHHVAHAPHCTQESKSVLARIRTTHLLHSGLLSGRP